MALAALALVLALVLGACGEKPEPTGPTPPQRLDLALDFYVNADHAGIYEGIEEGYFRAAGLEVKPQVPSDPSAPIREVAAGSADLAISYEPEVLLAHNQGLSVIAVAALVDRPLTTLISLPGAGIDAPQDLERKRIATAGIPYQRDYLETILDGAGLSLSDVEVNSVGLNLLPALLGGRVDAILGGFSNIEGVDLARRGENPKVVGVEKLGVPTYDELVVVANSDTVANDPEQIRLFLAALADGTRDAARDPAGATDAILEAGQGLDRAQTRAEVDATLPLLNPGGKHRYGFMAPAEWEAYAGWMASHHLINSVPDLGDVLTNSLLPPRAAK